MRALLDINVLIALLDGDHVHHKSAWGWFEHNIEPGWATCPITQNGCIRISDFSIKERTDSSIVSFQNKLTRPGVATDVRLEELNFSLCELSAVRPHPHGLLFGDFAPAGGLRALQSP